MSRFYRLYDRQYRILRGKYRELGIGERGRGPETNIANIRLLMFVTIRLRWGQSGTESESCLVLYNLDTKLPDLIVKQLKTIENVCTIKAVKKMKSDCCILRIKSTCITIAVLIKICQTWHCIGPFVPRIAMMIIFHCFKCLNFCVW